MQKRKPLYKNPTQSYPTLAAFKKNLSQPDRRTFLTVSATSAIAGLLLSRSSSASLRDHEGIIQMIVQVVILHDCYLLCYDRYETMGEIE